MFSKKGRGNHYLPVLKMSAMVGSIAKELEGIKRLN